MKDDNNVAFHTTCFACGRENKQGLHLDFKDGVDGCTCNVAIPPEFQSYEGVVHGGIVATMLDAAMVHSLRGHGGGAPVTCRLEVRYLCAVPPGETITINARRKGNRGKIILADAELRGSGVCYARARGAFAIAER
jgi:acyl-coenzyme A thioesterase PaaI-like protein